VDLSGAIRHEREIATDLSRINPPPGALRDENGKLLSLGLFGPIADDFKELEPEWLGYIE
jgi:hypothetical protein